MKSTDCFFLMCFLNSLLIGKHFAKEVCSVRRLNQQSPVIPEGYSVRMNSDDGTPCFQLCSCPTNGNPSSLIADCTTNHCLNPRRDNIGNCSVTSNTHGRDVWHFETIKSEGQGICVCYFDEVICEEPNSDLYTLKPGEIYLFLGYSPAEETLLKPWTDLGASNVTKALQELIDSPQTRNNVAVQNKFKIYDPYDNSNTELNLTRETNKNGCKLTPYAITPGNIIITVTNDKHKAKGSMEDLTDEDKQKPSTTSESMEFRHIKAHCRPVLEKLKLLIDVKSPIIFNNQILSIIKVAGIKEMPYAGGSASARGNLGFNLTIFISILSIINFYLRTYVST